jgi:hypothetical protein
MHVGGLLIFTLPDAAPGDYLNNIATRLREQRDFQAPWNLKVGQGLRHKLVPRWMEDPGLDLEYHFRHTALPKPGGERELGNLLSVLHSRALDPRRPLWELHLIEGLAPNRFALYLKIHHSMIDGTTVMRLLMEMLSDSPEVTDVKAIWTIGATAAPKEKTGNLPSVGGVVRATTGLVDAFTRPPARQLARRALLVAAISAQRTDARTTSFGYRTGSARRRQGRRQGVGRHRDA